jgi:hypothetical protein
VERPPPHHSLTLADYRRLEAEGKITRPLTDRPMEVRKAAFQHAVPDTPSRGKDTRTGTMREGALPARRRKS